MLAAEGGLFGAPAVRCIAAGGAAVHEYFYVEFPRRLLAVEQAVRLAEAEVALISRRLETYEPARSFGRYGATYTADHAWQIELLAAQQRLEQLRQQEAELWRERRLAAERWALQLTR
ncbi:MAG: hypothetical protein DCC67_14875 [Planctomycetota bacterium]|nr:MAG: hypothetical protein DCC67_14875 [Planctomycetota bacterium]